MTTVTNAMYTRILTFSEIYEAYQLKRYNNLELLEVVNADLQTKLVDTMIKGYPLKPIVCMMSFGRGGVTHYDILSGKENIELLVDFADHLLWKYAVSVPVLMLDAKDQEKFWQYPYIFHVVKPGLSDEELRDLVASLNL